jgi:enoyl-CoA hydratase/carnithine racemase
VFGEGAADLPPIPRPKGIWKPFIAAINGYAVGGGFPLALSCDLRVAGKSAVIGSSGLKRGAVQGAQQSQLLPRLIGISKALEILLLSKYVGGEEAAAMGMVQIAVDDSNVMEQAMEWAKIIAGYSPWAVQNTKRLVYEGFNMPLDQAYEWETKVTQEGYKRADAAAGFSEFLTKDTKKK